jgi:hypothetical protein
VVNDDKLAAFLKEASSKPVNDHWHCGLLLADWYMIATGRPDPAKPFRGLPYQDDNLIPSVEAIAAEVGLSETANPKRGDIGLLRLKNNGDQTFGAIFYGPRWIFLGRGGISGISPSAVDTIKAWRIPC